jgi:GlcNAc-P-P-Und epimerase
VALVYNRTRVREKRMSDFAGQNTIVIGGAGFIGIHLTQKLHSLGARVTVIDVPSADFSRLPIGAVSVPWDVCNPKSPTSMLLEADYVFHLAARTDLGGRTISDYAVNFDGPKMVLGILRDSRRIKRFVFYSTQLVTGIFNEARFITEDEPYRTRTLYGQSKILAEQAVRDLCARHSIPFVILRPTSVYGPFGKRPYREFFLTIGRKRYFHVGRAQNLISMCFVKNLVEQTLFLASEDRARDHIYFGSDLHPYTMREFSEAAAKYFDSKIITLSPVLVWLLAYLLGILKLLQIDVPLYPFRLRNITADYCYSIERSLRLGFVPPYGLQEGIRETLEWYCANDHDFSGLRKERIL